MKGNSLIGLDLVKYLAEHSVRIFDIKIAQEAAKQIGMNDKYLVESLYHLQKKGWIQNIKKGLYALASILLPDMPIHEYEIATHIITPSSISFWSAMHYHGLTQQIPNTVYISMPSNLQVPRLANKNIINGIKYRFITVDNKIFFGNEEYFIGNVQVTITNLEKTLLDIISRPKYSGGFSEIIYAYEQALNKVDIDKLVSYVFLFGNSSIRKLGWLLEHFNITHNRLEALQINFKGFIKLDNSGPAKGYCNKKWGVQENI